jgi:hypothetical protein
MEPNQSKAAAADKQRALPSNIFRYVAASGGFHQIFLVALTTIVFLIEIVPLEPDPKSDYDSFVLANIVPHDPAHNTGLWQRVERAVRLYAQTHEIYVITGPIFRSPALAALNGRVMVPWQLYKAVYDPQAKAAVAIISRNSTSGSASW